MVIFLSSRPSTPMKGFGIYVKNDLLDPKHVEKISEAVWLYLWLLDKITSISEEQIGKILGGKPIQYKQDILPELGVSESTYNRWVNILREGGYIHTIRAPYGLIIEVTKASKIFKRTVKNDGTRTVKSEERTVKNEASSVKIEDVIKTIQDNTNTIQYTSQPSAVDAEELSYEPDEDARPTKTGRGEVIKRLIKWAESKSGKKIINRGREDKAISKMLQGGYTEQQIMAAWEELEVQEWVKSGIGFALVASQIDKQKTAIKKKPSILISPDARKHET